MESLRVGNPFLKERSGFPSNFEQVEIFLAHRGENKNNVFTLHVVTRLIWRKLLLLTLQ